MPTITVALKEGKSYRSPKYNNAVFTQKPVKMTVDKGMYETLKDDGLLTVTVIEDDPAPPRPAKPATEPAAAPKAVAPKPAAPAGKPAPKVPAGNPLAPKPKAPAPKPAPDDSGE